MEEQQALNIQLEETLEKLWLKLQQNVQNHFSGTEEKRRNYMELLNKDKKGVAEVVENNKKIGKLTVNNK